MPAAALSVNAAAMSRLPKQNVAWLFVHTEGSGRGTPGNPVHGTAQSIHDYHRLPAPKGRGWLGIGYHVVIEKDGRAVQGRPFDRQGAQVEGMNSRSLGFVCTGDGDLADFNPAQRATLIRELAAACKAFNLPVTRVVGHREVNKLIDLDMVPKTTPRTPKTCPGRKVDMDAVRRDVAMALKS